MPKTSKSTHGFTLIELSIVLIIIGLILGSIVVGRSVVANFKIRSVVQDISKFNTAVESFKSIYGALPGDYSTATTQFGATDSHGNVILNGNGDGAIGNATLTSAENLAAWQHLALAQLITTGSYTAATSAATATGLQATVNVPSSGYATQAVYAFYYGNLAGNFNTGNSIMLINMDTLKSTIRASDASDIDTKIDDGTPYNRRVVGYGDSNGNCVTTLPPPYTLPYLTLTTTLCVMVFGVGGFILN